MSAGSASGTSSATKSDRGDAASVGAEEPKVEQEASLALGERFLDEAVQEDGSFRLTLPDGREVRGGSRALKHDEKGVLMVDGRISEPKPGRFFFQRQTMDGTAGKFFGHILFDEGDDAWKAEPSGPGGAPRLTRVPKDKVVCVNYPMLLAAGAPVEHAPEAHPEDIPLPDYQDIIPLQSLPGAAAVVYLDFDGEAGPFPSWGDFDAAAPAVTNAQVKLVWQMVCEDFQGFEINITTDRQVFDRASTGSRQHVIITPTTDAAPGFGGVAWTGSFGASSDIPCWVFYTTGKYCAEVISHETGHTLGLSHDGRNVVPFEDYYLGQGSGETGWAPIMGAGYYENVTQWSKGEYTLANRTENDLAIIVSNNNVRYRDDDAGETLASARYLEIAEDNSISNEGIIETRDDVDGFRFATSGGAVVLKVDPVALNPNLDVLLELVNTDSGETVATADPQATLGALIAMDLPAGEYILEVSGTGCGNPLLDGYSDYGSEGTYFISGSVIGGVKPLRFSLAENSAQGSEVGTVLPAIDHGSSALTWSIVSGNDSAAFTIDEQTGLLSVADASRLDFEALSTRWDVPATFQLQVSIFDAANPGLSEELRVVVTLQDVNDPPQPLDASAIVLERTRPGTALLTVSSSDPDHYDQPTFAITAGNENGWFSIDPGSGVISASDAGIGEVTEDTLVTLTVAVTDLGTPPLTATCSVSLTVLDIAAGHVPGGIVRTYYEGITGSTVSSLQESPKWPDYPDSEEFLGDFKAGEHGDNYGSRVHGYFIPPVSGNYRFWIASDGSGQLFLDEAGSSPIASVSGATDPGDWIDNAPYRSAQFFLVAGNAYRIEALHKESTGPDHISVAFSGPGIPKQLLSGMYLAPESLNYAPSIAASHFAVGEDAFAGQEVGSVVVADANGGDAHSGYLITAGNADGAFSIDSLTGKIRVATRGLLNAQATPSRTLTISVSDEGTPPLDGSGQVTIDLTPAGQVIGSGIRQQLWTNLTGSDIVDLTSDPRYPFAPDAVRVLSSFDSGANTGDNYGSRIRALLTPATSGYYTFYLASNEDAALFLGTDATPAGAIQIASVNGWTYYNQWTKYASQDSDPVFLQAGQSYYMETLQKEAIGSDHVQVAWTGPGISAPVVIPGTCLAPFNINIAPEFTLPAYALGVSESATAGEVLGTISASDPEGERLLYAILDGDPDGTFAIDAESGVITLANPAGLALGSFELEIGVQDGGLQASYPYKTTTVTVTITVLGDNHAPVFDEGSLAGANAREGEAYTGSPLRAGDEDSGDTLVFTKIDGPVWLAVAEDGSLSGTPPTGSAGPNVFTVQVTDGAGDFAVGSLRIEVTQGGLPLPWVAGNVGSGDDGGWSLAGSHGEFHLSGEGQLAARSDSFQFLWQPLSGDGMITARVDSMDDTGPLARAGVMIRDSLASNSRHVFMGVSGDGGYRWVRRTGLNGNTSTASSGTASFPDAWVRLVRSGDVITAWKSADGINWVLLGSLTAALPETCYLGLAVASGSAGVQNEAHFSNVSLTP